MAAQLFGWSVVRKVVNVLCLREEPRGDVDVFLMLLASCFNNCFVDFIPGLSLFDVYILDVGVSHIVLPHAIAYAIAVVRGRTKFGGRLCEADWSSASRVCYGVTTKVFLCSRSKFATSWHF